MKHPPGIFYRYFEVAHPSCSNHSMFTQDYVVPNNCKSEVNGPSASVELPTSVERHRKVCAGELAEYVPHKRNIPPSNTVVRSQVFVLRCSCSSTSTKLHPTKWFPGLRFGDTLGRWILPFRRRVSPADFDHAGRSTGTLGHKGTIFWHQLTSRFLRECPFPHALLFYVPQQNPGTK